jgi:hypothetical protein
LALAFKQSRYVEIYDSCKSDYVGSVAILTAELNHSEGELAETFSGP